MLRTSAGVTVAGGLCGAALFACPSLHAVKFLLQSIITSSLCVCLCQPLSAVLFLQEAAQREAWESQQAAARNELAQMQTQLAHAQAERAALEAQYTAQQQAQAQPALLPLASSLDTAAGMNVAGAELGGSEVQAWQQQHELDQGQQQLQLDPAAAEYAATQAEAGRQAAEWAAWHEQQEQELADQQAAWVAQQAAMSGVPPPLGPPIPQGGLYPGQGGGWGQPEDDPAIEAQKNELALMAALAAEGDGVMEQGQGQGQQENVQPHAAPIEVAGRPSRERIRVAVRARPLTNPREEVSAFVIDAEE